MATNSDTKRIPFSDIAGGLNQAYDNADPQRLAGLQNLHRVRAAKETALKREQARLSTKLGPDHPRVMALTFKLSANQDFQHDLALGISRAQAPTVATDPNLWILHGYVLDSARAGLHGLTIGLYDQKNRWIEMLGHACTDKNGYFRLSYQGEKPATPAVTVSTRLEISGQTNTTAGMQAYIHVLDAKGTTQYVDTRPLQPTLGQVDYREIILDGEDTGCKPPLGSLQPTPEVPQPTPGTQPPTSQSSRPPPEQGSITGTEKTGRYLGNSSSHEVHDLQNVKKRCQIDVIKADHRVYFNSEREAVAAGYNFCSYCFGKAKSKR